LAEWTLAYGIGEFPAESDWVQIHSSVSESNYTTNQGMITSGGLSSALNTKNLPKGTLYKLRLQAKNRAGTIFNTYTLFVPMPSSIVYPLRNQVIIPQRGYFPLVGHASIDDGKTYSVSIKSHDFDTLWESQSFSQPYPDYPEKEGLFTLMGNHESERLTSTNSFAKICFPPEQTASVNIFPDAGMLSDGFITYNLRVAQIASAESLFVDDTNFPIEYIPLKNVPGIRVAEDPFTNVPIDFSDLISYFYPPTSRSYSGLVICPENNGISSRLIVGSIWGDLVLDAGGNSIWQHRTGLIYNTRISNILIEDIDGDGASEIIFLGKEPRISFTPAHTRLYVLDGNTGHRKTGFGGIIKYEDNPNRIVGTIAMGNFDKDLQKEVAIGFMEENESHMCTDYIQIFDIDKRDSQGKCKKVWRQIVALRRFDTYQTYQNRCLNSIQIKDFNVCPYSPGKSSVILFPYTGQILDGKNKTFFPAFKHVGSYEDADFVKSGSSYNIILRTSNMVYLKDVRGRNLPGWPISSKDYALVMHENSNEHQIALYSEDSGTVIIVNQDGGTVANGTEIHISDIYGNMISYDVDGDGNNEILVMRRHATDKSPSTTNDPVAELGDGIPTGDFLEAYSIDGRRLADTDNRWPINISCFDGKCLTTSKFAEWNYHIAIGDIDDDNLPEFIQYDRIAPAWRECREGHPGLRLEITNIEP
jgi:hypothetical protein